MTDNRRSLSPLTRVYSALQATLTPDQFDRVLPLVNTAIRQNTMSDDDFAREQQRHLYNVQSMEVDEPFPSFVPSFYPQRNAEIDADAAFARRLQEEEYSRRSIVAQPFRPPAHMNKRTPTTYFNPNDSATASDAAIAAQLQAEEERRARRHEQRPRSNPPQHPTPPPRPPPPLPLDPRPDTPETNPMMRLTLRRPTASHRASNNDANNNHLTNLLQMVRQGPPAAQANRSGFRRIRDAHNHQGNFGPNDYESLLELDNNVRNNPLTAEQINRLPTERFQGARNANDEENKCSVCWDDFEKNQVLRRLLCFHLFHKDCIDKWLKDKNQCPICRAPPIQ